MILKVIRFHTENTYISPHFLYPMPLLQSPCAPQGLIADNDGVMDAPCMFGPRIRPIVSVFVLILASLRQILAWQGLLQESNKAILACTC